MTSFCEHQLRGEIIRHLNYPLLPERLKKIKLENWLWYEIYVFIEIFNHKENELYLIIISRLSDLYIFCPRKLENICTMKLLWKMTIVQRQRFLPRNNILFLEWAEEKAQENTMASEILLFKEV